MSRTFESLQEPNPNQPNNLFLPVGFESLYRLGALIDGAVLNCVGAQNPAASTAANQPSKYPGDGHPPASGLARAPCSEEFLNLVINGPLHQCFVATIAKSVTIN